MGEIMDQEENLDLLDLEQESEVDALPEAAPFTAPRPKKPWLLMGVGIAIIILATWIVVAHIGGDSGTTVNVDLDTPAEKVEVAPAPVADLNVPAKPVEAVPAVKPEPKIAAATMVMIEKSWKFGTRKYLMPSAAPGRVME